MSGNYLIRANGDQRTHCHKEHFCSVFFLFARQLTWAVGRTSSSRSNIAFLSIIIDRKEHQVNSFKIRRKHLVFHIWISCKLETWENGRNACFECIIDGEVGSARAGWRQQSPSRAGRWGGGFRLPLIVMGRRMLMVIIMGMVMLFGCSVINRFIRYKDIRLKKFHTNQTMNIVL